MLKVTDEFSKFVSEIQTADITTYYDVESVQKAFESLPGQKQPTAHCVIFAKTAKQFQNEPIRAFVMVSNNYQFTSWLDRN